MRRPDAPRTDGEPVRCWRRRGRPSGGGRSATGRKGDRRRSPPRRTDVGEEGAVGGPARTEPREARGPEPRDHPARGAGAVEHDHPEAEAGPVHGEDRDALALRGPIGLRRGRRRGAQEFRLPAGRTFEPERVATGVIRRAGHQGGPVGGPVDALMPKSVVGDLAARPAVGADDEHLRALGKARAAPRQEQGREQQRGAASHAPRMAARRLGCGIEGPAAGRRGFRAARSPRRSTRPP
jgi:hypothetical protein